MIELRSKSKSDVPPKSEAFAGLGLRQELASDLETLAEVGHTVAVAQNSLVLSRMGEWVMGTIIGGRLAHECHASLRNPEVGHHSKPLLAQAASAPASASATSLRKVFDTSVDDAEKQSRA